MTLAAFDPYGNQPSDYNGAKTIDWGGASTAPDTTHTPVYPASSVAFDDNGVAATPLSATFYAAGPNTLTAADHTIASIAGKTSITVDPGSLASFSWTSQPANVQHAGTAIQAAVTAYDAYGNVDKNYDGTSPKASFSGLGDAVNGKGTASYGAFVNGVDQNNFTGYLTAAGSKISVSATGISQADSAAFDMHPGPLASFDWSTEPDSTHMQTAGQTIAAEIDAYDAYKNLDTDYDNVKPSYSGMSDSNGGCSGPCQPIGPTFFGGKATSGFKDFKAEHVGGITVTDGLVSAQSTAFDVGPAAASHLSVPTPATQKAGYPFDEAITALDPWDNIDTNYGGTSGIVTLHFSGPHNSPNASSPTYPPTVAFSKGSSTASLTLVDAETTSLSVSDGQISGTTPSTFDVGPGDLGSFSVATPASTRAGDAFSLTVTAQDLFGNVKADYAGTVHFTTTDPGPSTVVPADYAFTTGTGGDNGVHTFNGVILTKTPSQTISVADSSDPSKNGTSAAITVIPGPLDHFIWGPQPAASQVAGVPFSATVTAYDRFANVKTDYNSSDNTAHPVWSGLGAAPNSPHQPAGFGTFVDGVDGGQFVGYSTTPQSQTTKINVTDSTSNQGTTATADSAPFSIGPNDPGTASFVQQPTETQVNVAIAPAPTVQVSDIFGNAEYGEPVAMTLLPPSGGASQFTNTSTTQVTTDSTGLATFANLKIGTVALGYKMKATASRTPTIGGGTASDTSKPFTIAQTVNTCTRQNCSGSANDPNNSSATVAGNVQTDTNTLGIALTLNAPPRPSGSTICPTFKDAPGADGSFINVNAVSNGATKPNLTITWTVSKVLMNKIPISPQNFNNGAAHYDICLGAAYIDPLTTPHGFPTKNGGTAVPVADPITGVTFYWGIIPDCPKVPVNPCMLSRTKDLNGNPIFKYFVPYPYDPTGWAGGGI